MSDTLTQPAVAADAPRRIDHRPTPGDRVFRILATGAGTVSLVIVGTAAIFLFIQARPALSSSGWWRFFTSTTWNGAAGEFGVLGLLVGTILIGVVALSVAVPLAVGMAVFINEYAPARARRILISVIDLLAALPSLVFGIWGFFALQPQLVDPARFLNENLAAVPLFRVDLDPPSFVRSTFVAGLIVALMVLPIITSVSRDVMAQTPPELKEGALALGGTRWGMVRDVVLPFGRSGIVGATLLGFGRALGETIAVAIVLQIVFQVKIQILSIGGGSVAALIAQQFGEADEIEQSGLIAAGLALFALTFAINLAARAIVNRSGH